MIKCLNFNYLINVFNVSINNGGYLWGGGWGVGRRDLEDERKGCRFGS